ncbi:MAG: Uma2 family endonuclease [Microcoleaceae cyanobacterium]
MTESLLQDLQEEEQWVVDAPTQEDLPCDDGIPMETYRHKLQMDILVDAYGNWLTATQQQGFTGGNMFVYFSPDQVRNQDYRGPDVFVVKDVPSGERRSWVVWQEGKAPDVVVELLSPSTARRDKTEKKQIYQDQLRVTEYFWYDPFNPDDLAGFSLQGGVYQPLNFDDQQRLVSEQLGLALVRWSGLFKQVEATWLRWATLDGELLPTDRELVEQERQRAEQERQRAEQESQRADRLAERLRALGVDPDA